MSLLLDALKKAADDKKKNSSGGDTPVDVSTSVEQADDSLDLELQVSDDDNSPELDESALDNLKSHEEPELDIEEMTEELNAADARSNDHSAVDVDVDIVADSPSNKETTSAITDAPATETPETTSEIKTEIPTEPTEPVASNKIEEIIEAKVKPEKEELTLQATATTKTFDNNINNEHALSALINKSNHHSRSQKKRQLITIILLVTLAFIGSGLYFYIQLDTSNQDIYIPQSNPSNINRKQVLPERTSKAPAAKPKAEQTNVIEKSHVSDTQKTHAVTTQASKQVRKKASSTKAAIKPSSAKPVLSFVRTKKPDPVHTLLSSAYAEFNKGNYQASEKLYLQVLLRESRNRDALLGIAAIALKQSRYEVARQKYQYLLRLNPRDSLATAGLSSIKNLINPQLNETQLKFMIKQQPDAPHLYFALGSLYSVQNKWPEAQSAYFSAWSANNKNADYAYNLAVSLDHMNHPAQALNYYQLSLKLMSSSNSNFSVDNTQKRIRLLQETNQ